MLSSMLRAGANAPLTGAGPYEVIVTYDKGPDVDLTAFLLGSTAKVRSDQDMVFYNQNERTTQGVEWVESTTAGNVVTQTLVVDPSRWDADVETVRIGLTTEGTTFGKVNNLQAKVVDNTGATVATFDLSSRDQQNAFIVGDVYRRGGTMKVRCQAAGFTNGLAGLATDVGVTIDDEPSDAQPTEAINLVKQLADTPLPANASTIDIRKKTLAVVLVKSKLDGKIFRVVLLIDASGSMDGLYAKRGGGFFGGGTEPSVVQCSLERMVPVADLLDDNHEMEVWYFGSRPSYSESVTIHTMEGYVDRTRNQKSAAGWSNDEVRAMTAVIDWVKANPSEYPTLVLAWSDGGVGNEAAIKRLLVQASSLAIFWMWLGLGGSESLYGALARLDQVEGGVVDNAGFIHLDDIEKESDKDLYERIFAFVSKWYREAQAAGVITV